MASLRITLRPNKSNPLQGTLVYRVIHRREVRRIKSDVTVSISDWDEEEQCISASTPESIIAQNTINTDATLIRNIIKSFDESRPRYSTDDIIAEYRRCKDIPSFSEFVRKEIDRRSSMNCSRIAVAYSSSLGRFNAFSNNSDIRIDCIDCDIIEAFQHWLIGTGICKNTISFYMRNLRAVYNRAVRLGITPDQRPFANAFTGIEKTRKRAISHENLKKIKELTLSQAHLCRVRDLFMLSFYCMGMSFVDLAFLKKSNLVNGRIVYRRSKTRQTISFSVNSKITNILKKYAGTDDSIYLLDIISKPDVDPRRQYLSALNLFNRHLKKIGALAGLTTILTTYVSRHSWASLAKSKNISISTISDALGHENESTTQIYLASLEIDEIDRANDIVTRGL